MRPGEQMLGAAGEIFHLAQDAGEPGLLRKIVAAGSSRVLSARQATAQKLAPIQSWPRFLPAMTYQPVIMERRLFQLPDSTTMAI